MFIDELQTSLTPRKLQIWQGTSGLDPELEQQYRDKWLAESEDKIIETSRGNTLLCDDRLRVLIRLIRSVAHLPGNMAEFGTWKGGSAKVISLSNPKKVLHCFDTWKGIPQDDVAPGGHKKGDFATSLDECRAFLKDLNIKLHVGVFPQSVPPALRHEKYSFVFLDCDTTQSLKAGLNYFYRRLVDGGIIVVDDYGRDTCPGIKPVFDELDEHVEELENCFAYIVKGQNDKFPAPKKLLLTNHLSPGDMMIVTACLESLHRQYPGSYLTAVDGTWKDDVYRHNPRVSNLDHRECKRIKVDYNQINELSRRDVSFVQSMCETVGKAIGKPLVPQVTKPIIYLNEDENKPLPGLPWNYCVINAGKKNDYPIKNPSWHLWREVVEALSKRIAFVQIGEATPGHTHKPLPGAINWIGKTSPRQLFRLAKFAVAGCGPVTCLMHCCAAFDVPYVCLGMGREEQGFAPWNSTTYLHTQGALPCCKEKGCWKSKVAPDKRGGEFCELPVINNHGECVPKCLEMIGSSGVISALDKILKGRDL